MISPLGPVSAGGDISPDLSSTATSGDASNDSENNFSFGDKHINNGAQGIPAWIAVAGGILIAGGLWFFGRRA